MNVSSGRLPEQPAAVTDAVLAWMRKLPGSRAAVNALRDDVVRALAAPDVREKLAAQGAEPSSFTPEEFARFLKEDTRRWTEVIRASGIRVEQ
jgi:tripartite-type tricarboxylate transporter receptor subunit TctC